MKPFAVILALLAAACASAPERPERSVQELFAAREAENSVREADFNVLMNGFLARARQKPTVDLLIISGGGDWGAFGAGVLKGWGTLPAASFTKFHIANRIAVSWSNIMTYANVSFVVARS